MIEIGDKINKRLKHFSDICPDIPLEEQVELRKLGNQYLEVLDKLLDKVGGLVNKDHPFYSLFLNDYENFADYLDNKPHHEGLSYADVIINGICYENEALNNKFTKEEIEKSYIIYDETYNQVMHMLKKCKEQGIEPEKIVLLDWKNKS